VHLHPGAEIHYWARDARRQDIPYVRYRAADGRVTEYVATEKGKPPPRPDPGALRLMDCMDCHNRPSHAFELPAAAVDAALAAGVLDRTLPFVKKTALEVLQGDYASHAEAAAGIRSRVAEFYRARYPEIFARQRAAIERAGDTLAGVYAGNVFPAMKVGWGTYANNLGHQDFPGCFRCHDGAHAAEDGSSISSDCGACHALLALDDAEPEILKQLAE
jgi:hypothetical protein